MNNAELKKHLVQRRESLRSVEQKHEDQWRELRDYVNPFRGRFASERPDDYKPSFTKILDSSPLMALRILAAGMQSGLTSPSRQWFKISLHNNFTNTSQAVKAWCDEIQRRMLSVMSSSGFYRALHMLYEEIALFGTGCMVILPDNDNVINCQTLTAGTFCLGRMSGNRIDSFYRDMWMTAGEIISEFGEENVSDAVSSAFKSNKDTLFKVYHAIEPDIFNVTKHEFISVYWEPVSGDEKLLRIGGFNTFPVMTPRWTATDSDVYGYGPASEALPDIKTMLALKTDLLTGIKKTVNPPLVASRQVLTGGIKTMPGGITYIDGNASGAMVAPLYNVPIDIRNLSACVEQYKNDIRRAMYVDLFMMLSNDSGGGRMTAKEVAERHEEKMLALGPVLEALEWELLVPAIDRVFDIMATMNLIPPVPEDLSNCEVKIEFVSILAQAQKMMGLSALEQSVNFAGFVARVDPNLLDCVNVEQVLRNYVEMVGAPANILREEDEVAQIRAQKEQAQMQALQMQQAQQEAQVAQTTARAANDLGKTPMTNGGTALDAITEIMSGKDNTPLGNIVGGMA